MYLMKSADVKNNLPETKSLKIETAESVETKPNMHIAISLIGKCNLPGPEQVIWQRFYAGILPAN